MKANQVILYSLSTCAYCSAIKKMLDKLNIEHTCIQADELPDSEKEQVIAGRKEARTLGLFFGLDST